jgi:cytochrome c-type biogenesis protein CcmH/NrfF
MTLALVAMFLLAGVPGAQQRVEALENRLMAPCCYEEPVRLHQSEAAVKMRMEIERMVQAGKKDEEIFGFYTAQYGEKILAPYAPTPGWAAWAPWGLTLCALAALAWWLPRMVRRAA